MFLTEWRKLHTTRTPLVMLAITQILIVLGASGLLARDDVTDPATTTGAVAHVGLLALMPLVLGIMAVAGEYRHRTITDTYLGSPRRARVIGVKLAVYAGVGLAFGVVGTLTALVTTALWLAGRGSHLDLGTTGLWPTIIGGIVWNGLFAALGVGLGAVVRNLVGAIAGTLAWLALVEGLVAQLIGDSAGRWLPFRAGASLGRTQLGGVSQWSGGLVLAAYAVLVALVAVWTTSRTDVA